MTDQQRLMLIQQLQELEAIQEKLKREVSYYELQLILTQAKLDKKMEELRLLSLRLEADEE